MSRRTAVNHTTTVRAGRAAAFVVLVSCLVLTTARAGQAAETVRIRGVTLGTTPRGAEEVR